jgi:hypothetical protein
VEPRKEEEHDCVKYSQESCGGGSAYSPHFRKVGNLALYFDCTLSKSKFTRVYPKVSGLSR